MTKRTKRQEPKTFTAFVVGGEQVVAATLCTEEQRDAIIAEFEADLGLDGSPMNRVLAEAGWTRAELESWAKKDCAPSYILDDDFEWDR